MKRQAGVVTRAQALEAGLSQGAVRAHLAAGRWESRCTRGSTGRSRARHLDRRGCGPPCCGPGPGAVLSHESAAELSGLVDEARDPVHVTVPTDRRVRHIPGVIVHRSPSLADATQPGPALARTRIEETVVDLATAARRQESAVGWVTRACGRRLTTPPRIRDVIMRRRRVRWRRLLLAVVDDAAEGCHSVLERRYLRDVERDHRLPCGRRQAVRQAGAASTASSGDAAGAVAAPSAVAAGPAGASTEGRRRSYADVAYEEFATVVELDGRADHPEERRADDRQRDNASAAAGVRTLRYGWADVGSPCVVALQVAGALRAGGWQGQPRRCRRPGCQFRSEELR